MIHLEQLLPLTQNQLFKALRHKYHEQSIVCKGNFILVRGEAPVLLLAHLDTVHHEPVRQICKSHDGNILMSPQGIGGDDRCGVYALIKIHQLAKTKPWLLFTCNEETGGIGADAFCLAHQENELPAALDNLKCLIEIDRKGNNDAVYYDCDNKDFEAYITSKGFKTAIGSFTDISLIAPELGVAAVNLSSGYYNPHTLHEFINRAELEAVISKVVEIVTDSSSPDFPQYNYLERPRQKTFYRVSTWRLTPLDNDSVAHFARFNDEATSPPPLPSKYQQIYDELLEVYTTAELEELRLSCGDQILLELYLDDFYNEK